MTLQDRWTWYCVTHDSTGRGFSESEIEMLVNAHKAFYLDKAPCDVWVKNRKVKVENAIHNSNSAPESLSYMERVKSKFNRAWSKWANEEDEELSDQFSMGLSLEQLSQIHQRAQGGIVARLRKLKLVDEKATTGEIRNILKQNGLRGSSKVQSDFSRNTQADSQANLRTERGKASLRKFGTVNPPPVPLPDFGEAVNAICPLCNSRRIGNSCLCRNN